MNVWCEINKEALTHNLNVFRDIIGDRKILIMVKQNAYGHGLISISKFCQDNGVDYLGISTVQEGMDLRANDITLPIIIFAPNLSSDEINDCIDLDISLTAHSIADLERINLCGYNSTLGVKVHINFDTGMGRTGIREEDLPILYSSLLNWNWLSFKGIYTHFPVSDYTCIKNDIELESHTFTNNQIKKFNEIIKEITKKISREYLLVHAANSGAMLNNITDSFYDMVRIGISFYGCYPNFSMYIRNPHQLKQALVLKGKIIHLKTVKKGNNISYGRTYTTEKEERIATIGIGYAHGLNRLLSNQGNVLINGKQSEIVGNITMCETMIKVTDISNVKIYDEVIIYDSINKSAYLINTIPQELLCNINKNIKRIYM